MKTDMVKKNPYQYLRAIEPSFFIGRWNTVNRIALDLICDEGDSYSLIAGRRCGKSSCLLALSHALKDDSLLEQADWQALPIIFDFKSESFDSERHFLAHLLSEVRRRVDLNVRLHPSQAIKEPLNLDAQWFKSLTEEPSIALQEFVDSINYVLDSIGHGNTRLVILFDEIDMVLNEPWSETLFDRLRALISSSDIKERVRIILAGSRKLLKVDESGSPLFNMLKREFLQPLSQEDILRLAGRAPELPEDIRNLVWLQSGGQPFLAQYLLHHLYEDHNHTNWDDCSEKDLQTVVNRFVSEHYEDLEVWAMALEASGLRSYGILCLSNEWLSEKEVFDALSDPASNIKKGLAALCYHGVLEHKNWNHYRYTGELFKGWFEACIKKQLKNDLSREMLLNQIDDVKFGNIFNINTDGGTYIQGDVETSGGSFIGRDKTDI